MTWHRVASISEVEVDRGLAVRLGDKCLAIYRVHDKLYALDDVCPHGAALLSDGVVDGDTVECPLHQAIFQISTGACLLEPAECDLATFQVKVEGDDILIDL